MGIATGLTKERMLQIESQSVVSGLVGLDGRLLLYTRGDEEIDAGNVTGPKGDKGDKGNTGDKGDKGDKGDAGNPATATTNAGALTSGTLDDARLNWDVPRGRYSINSNYDWNTITDPGTYEVSGRGANAPGAYDYGALVVHTMTNGMTEQLYYEHGGNRSIYQRLKYVSGSTWNGWTRHPQVDEIYANVHNGEWPWLPDPLQRSAQNISNGNLFDYRSTGHYRGSGVANAPDGNWWYYHIIRHDDNYVNYTAYEFFGQRVFRGRIDNGGWQGWTELITSQDSNWQSANYVNGFSGGGTPGTIQYRSKGGIIYWRGGANGTFVRGTYHVVMNGLPQWCVAPIALRGGAMGSGISPAGFEINNGEYAVKLGWNVRTGSTDAAAPTWVAFNASYPREY